MKKLTKNLGFATMLLTLIVSFFILSCKKEKEKEPTVTVAKGQTLCDDGTTGYFCSTSTNTTQDKADLSTTSDKLSTDATDMTSTTGGEAGQEFVSFIGTDDVLFTARTSGGFKGIYQRTKLIIKNTVRNLPFRDGKSSGRIASDTLGQFCFDCKLGTYNWVPVADSGSWTYTAGGSSIIMKFPSDSANNANNNNNGILTISNYKEKNYLVGYIPTNLDVDLTISGTKQASISFSFAWKNNFLPNIDLTLFLNPFTFSFSLVSQSLLASAEVTISRNASVMYGIGLTLNIDDDQGGVQSAEGYVQLYSHKLATSSPIDLVTLHELDAIADSTGIPVSDLNTNINIDVINNNVKVGEIIFKDNPTSSEPDVYIRWSADGSDEPAENYFCQVGESACTGAGGTWDAATCECL